MIYDSCTRCNRVSVDETPAFPTHKIERINYRIKFFQPAIVRPETIIFPYTSFFTKINFNSHFIAKKFRCCNYLASRIAAKAEAGKVLCSYEFIDALSNKSSLNLRSKGRQEFKNLNNQKEVFELAVDQKKLYHIDPVCRMLILDTRNAITHPVETGHYFCSSACFDVYHNHAKDSLN